MLFEHNLRRDLKLRKKNIFFLKLGEESSLCNANAINNIISLRLSC